MPKEHALRKKVQELNKQVNELEKALEVMKELEAVGIPKDAILNILIDHNKKHGELLTLVTLLEIKEKLKENDNNNN